MRFIYLRFYLQLQNKIEEKKTKNRKSVPGPSKQSQKNKTTKSNILSTPVHRASNVLKQPEVLVKEGSDMERDVARIACIPPDFVKLPTESPVLQVTCGLHHTVLLMQNGQVCCFNFPLCQIFYTFVIFRCTVLVLISMDSLAVVIF